MTTETTEPDRQISPARGLAVDALGYLPRVVAGALDDLRTIAESVRVLPEVARTLATIERETSEMSREVKLMREGVDRLGEKVDGLDGDIVKVVDGVAPIEGKLDEMNRTLHPLSRLTRRARGD